MNHSGFDCEDTAMLCFYIMHLFKQAPDHLDNMSAELRSVCELASEYTTDLSLVTVRVDEFNRDLDQIILDASARYTYHLICLCKDEGCSSVDGANILILDGANAVTHCPAYRVKDHPYESHIPIFYHNTTMSGAVRYTWDDMVDTCFYKELYATFNEDRAGMLLYHNVDTDVIGRPFVKAIVDDNLPLDAADGVIEYAEPIDALYSVFREACDIYPHSFDIVECHDVHRLNVAQNFPESLWDLHQKDPSSNKKYGTFVTVADIKGRDVFHAALRDERNKHLTLCSKVRLSIVDQSDIYVATFSLDKCGTLCEMLSAGTSGKGGAGSEDEQDLELGKRPVQERPVDTEEEDMGLDERVKQTRVVEDTIPFPDESKGIEEVDPLLLQLGTFDTQEYKEEEREEEEEAVPHEPLLMANNPWSIGFNDTTLGSGFINRALRQTATTGDQDTTKQLQTRCKLSNQFYTAFGNNAIPCQDEMEHKACSKVIQEFRDRTIARSHMSTLIHKEKQLSVFWPHVCASYVCFFGSLLQRALPHARQVMQKLKQDPSDPVVLMALHGLQMDHTKKGVRFKVLPDKRHPVGMKFTAEESLFHYVMCLIKKESVDRFWDKNYQDNQSAQELSLWTFLLTRFQIRVAAINFDDPMKTITKNMETRFSLRAGENLLSMSLQEACPCMVDVDVRNATPQRISVLDKLPDAQSTISIAQSRKLCSMLTDANMQFPLNIIDIANPAGQLWDTLLKHGRQPEESDQKATLMFLQRLCQYNAFAVCYVEETARDMRTIQYDILKNGCRVDRVVGEAGNPMYDQKCIKLVCYLYYVIIRRARVIMLTNGQDARQALQVDPMVYDTTVDIGGSSADPAAPNAQLPWLDRCVLGVPLTEYFDVASGLLMASKHKRAIEQSKHLFNFYQREIHNRKALATLAACTSHAGMMADGCLVFSFALGSHGVQMLPNSRESRFALVRNLLLQDTPPDLEMVQVFCHACATCIEWYKYCLWRSGHPIQDVCAMEANKLPYGIVADAEDSSSRIIVFNGLPLSLKNKDAVLYIINTILRSPERYGSQNTVESKEPAVSTLDAEELVEHQKELLKVMANPEYIRCGNLFAGYHIVLPHKQYVKRMFECLERLERPQNTVVLEVRSDRGVGVLGDEEDHDNATSPEFSFDEHSVSDCSFLRDVHATPDFLNDYTAYLRSICDANLVTLKTAAVLWCTTNATSNADNALDLEKEKVDFCIVLGEQLEFVAIFYPSTEVKFCYYCRDQSQQQIIHGRLQTFIRAKLPRATRVQGYSQISHDILYSTFASGERPEDVSSTLLCIMPLLWLHLELHYGDRVVALRGGAWQKPPYRRHTDTMLLRLCLLNAMRNRTPLLQANTYGNNNNNTQQKLPSFEIKTTFHAAEAPEDDYSEQVGDIGMLDTSQLPQWTYDQLVQETEEDDEEEAAQEPTDAAAAATSEETKVPENAMSTNEFNGTGEMDNGDDELEEFMKSLDEQAVIPLEENFDLDEYMRKHDIEF
jgi:hypothetical protein